MRKMIAILLGAMLTPAISIGAYKSKELCFIPWGDGENQLKIAEPYLEYGDDTTGQLWPSGGPTQGFIDNIGNIYISSQMLSYFKIFNGNGILKHDFSVDSNEYDTSMYINSVGSFFVDSLFNIYIESQPPIPYIYVIDSAGKAIDRIAPLGGDSLADISALGFGSMDVIAIECFYKGIYTYKDGIFHEGGSFSWYGVDGFYHAIVLRDSSTLAFKKCRDFDLFGIPVSIDVQNIIYAGKLASANFIAVDNDLRLYTSFYDNSRLEGGILVYGSDYRLLDKIIKPRCDNKFMWCLKPFVRGDGTIYEFRVLDDGLHVIKWTKQ